MKLLRTLLRSRAPKQPKPKRKKKPLGAALLALLIGYGLDALKSHWNHQLWNQSE